MAMELQAKDDKLRDITDFMHMILKSLEKKKRHTTFVIGITEFRLLIGRPTVYKFILKFMTFYHLFRDYHAENF